MRPIRIVPVLLSLALSSLTGCLGDANEQTVRAENLWCNLSGGPVRELEMVFVECVVKVGGTLVSKEGIQTSVKSMLSVNVMPEVCPSYTRAELVASTDEFSDDVHDELAAAYVQASADWDIDSVHCSITK